MVFYQRDRYCMDNEEFLKRLSEVSEWSRPQVGPTGCASVRKGHPEPEHPGAITEAELEEMTDEEVELYYAQLIAWREAQPNETLRPVIQRVKVQAKNCEDCDRHCPEGRRTQRKLHYTGSRHWREWCQTCELFRDPATGKFTLPKLGSHQYFGSYYRPKLGVYDSKYQTADGTGTEPTEPRRGRGRPRKLKPVSREEILRVIHEDQDSIIRSYVADRDK